MAKSKGDKTLLIVIIAIIIFIILVAAGIIKINIP